MNCPYCGAIETTGGTVHGEGCWQAPKRSTVAVSRLPDAERIARVITEALDRTCYQRVEDRDALVARVLREEGVAE